MRTLEEIIATTTSLPMWSSAARAVELALREAHALGRSEGFAEGVEAAARACQAEDPNRSSYIGRATLNRAEGRIRALRAPSPATGVEAGCATRFGDAVAARHREAAERAVYGTPPPKEDAPRCEACGRDWWTPDSRCPDCGTGRSTTGGGR